MDRARPVALVVAAAAFAFGACDTGDGRTLRPPPPTTTPPPTVTATTVPEAITFEDGFGTLTFVDDGGPGSDLGFAVSLCRWQPDGAAVATDGQPVLTLTGDGVTPDGDRYALTLEELVAGDLADGRVAVSFTSGPLWQGTGPGGVPPTIEVIEQAAGLVVRAELEVTEIHPTDDNRPLGVATLDLTCL